MPLTLTLTDGAIPSDKIEEAVVRLTDAMLETHQLGGNSVMTPNITANVLVVPPGAHHRIVARNINRIPKLVWPRIATR